MGNRVVPGGSNVSGRFHQKLQVNTASGSQAQNDQPCEPSEPSGVHRHGPDHKSHLREHDRFAGGYLGESLGFVQRVRGSGRLRGGLLVCINASGSISQFIFQVLSGLSYVQSELKVPYRVSCDRILLSDQGDVKLGTSEMDI